MKFLLGFLALFSSLFSVEKSIYLFQNFTQEPLDLSFLDSPFLAGIRETLQKRNLKIKLSTLEEVDAEETAVVVVWNTPPGLRASKLKRIPKEKAVLFLWEPPTVQKKLYSPKLWNHFQRIYTWDDDLVDNNRFFKFYYPVLQPMISSLPSFQEKKLLSFIFAHKASTHPQELYTEREKVIRFFEDKPAEEFEFYGKGWKKEKYKNYRGAPADKIDVLKNYRFSICYENMQGVKGYVTEKIFDCFKAGTVPIYWGASNIETYVPKECFIDRRKFKTNQELYAFIKGIDETTYTRYLEAIRSYLKSDQAQLFSMELFHAIFLEAITEKTNE